MTVATRFEDKLRERGWRTVNDKRIEPSPRGVLLSHEERDALADAVEALRAMDKAATDAFGDPQEEDGFDNAHRSVRSALARLDGEA